MPVSASPTSVAIELALDGGVRRDGAVGAVAGCDFAAAQREQAVGR